MATVQLQGVTKSFGGAEIIKGVDLTIEDREFVVFVGPSGCGKTTLLRLIAGLEQITFGELRIDGTRVNDVAPAKRGLALVFQSYALYPHMTVAENMAFSLKLAGVGPEERNAKVQQAARILHLQDYLQQKPKQLSGGQRQRVAIGRAIVRNPKVFLFDEPLSNLDAALRAGTRLELMNLHKQLNATMIYVTHDQIEAMTMADKIVVLRKGRIEQVGSPLHLYRHPANRFVAGFIGSPPMNFLPGRVESVRQGSVTVRLGNGYSFPFPVSGEALVPQQEVEFGIRPEHVVLDNASPLRARVDIVERLGAEAYLHLKLQDQSSFVVKTAGDIPLEAGEEVGLRIEPALGHLFDGAGIAIPAHATAGFSTASSAVV